MYKEAIFRIVELEEENRGLAALVAAMEAASEHLVQENNTLKEKAAQHEAELSRLKSCAPASTLTN